jgi:multiple sugar transport system substrate-binding protein
MKMKKVTITLLSLMLCTSTIFAGGSKEAASTKGSDARIKMVIDLDDHGHDHPEMYYSLENLNSVEGFENVDVESLPYDPEFKSTLPIAIASGEQKDVLYIPNAQYLKDWAEADIIVPLDEYVAASGYDWEKEYGSYAEQTKVNGKIYGVPNSASQWALYYNKDIFDAAGVEYPDANIPMTWDDYNEIAKKLTSGEGADKIYGTLEVNWQQFWYDEAIITLGGAEHFYTADGKASNIEDPAFRRSMENRYKRMHIDKSTPTYADVATSKTQVQAFMGGKYGMIFEGAWALDWLKDKKNYPRDWRVGIAPMPVDEGTQKKSFGTLNMLCVAQTSANRQVAFDLAKYLEDEYCKITTAPHPNMVIEQPYVFSNINTDFKDDGITKEDVINLFGNGDIQCYAEMMSGIASGEYNQIIKEETELYFVQEQDIDTTISNIKMRADAAIKKALAE